MKKVKITFWLIIIVFLGLLVFQNQNYFFAKHSLGIDLLFTKRILPYVNNLVIIAVFFIFGLFLAYVSTLFEKFKSRKIIKELKNTISSNKETIAQMRKEVDALKSYGHSELASDKTQEPGNGLKEDESGAAHTSNT
ncbi:MAG: LapA family protein [Desulfobacteraceae bacterium]|nr:LapA family protein [Desulfobacteraceae bacterium]